MRARLAAQFAARGAEMFTEKGTAVIRFASIGTALHEVMIITSRLTRGEEHLFRECSEDTISAALDRSPMRDLQALQVRDTPGPTVEVW